jgi:tetratricopeptide (TPR) repeat protein
MRSPGTEAGNWAFRSLFYAEAGQPDNARRCADEAAEIAERAGQGDSLSFYYLWLAKIFSVLDDDPQAGLEAADKAVDFSRRFNDYFCLIHSLNLKARFHLALDQQELARTAIGEFQPMMDIVFCNHRRQELLWTLYLERKAAGDRRKAAEFLGDAVNFINLIAARIEDAGLRRSWLEDIPINPQIIAEAAERGLSPHSS